MRDLLVITRSLSAAQQNQLNTPAHNYTKSQDLNSKLKFFTAGNGDSNANLNAKNRPQIAADIGPLLLEVKPALSSKRKRRLKYYTWLAAKLAEEGRLADFTSLVKTLREAGANAINFMQALNMKLVWAGFGRQIENGGLYLVLESLKQLGSLRCHPPKFLDNNARQLLSKECWKLLEQGDVNECISILQILSDCLFRVQDFVEPIFIIKQCIKLKDAGLALRYVSLLPPRHIWCNFLIREFGKQGDLKLALIIFRRQQRANISPDMYLYRDIIDACGLCGKLAKAKSIFKELLDQNVTPNVFLYNSFMNANARDLDYALQIYKQMQNSGVVADVTTYNILLKICCIAKRVDLAVHFYKEMLFRSAEGDFKMDVISYNTIIQVFGEAKMWAMAMEVKKDMIAAGVAPDIVTWTSLIGAYGNAGLLEKAIQVFDEMVLSGCEPNTQCCNTLLQACVEFCHYGRAFRFFKTWKEKGFYEASAERQKECVAEAEKDIPLDATTLNGKYLSHNNQTSIPVVHTQPSKMSKFKPTVVTYNILMRACGSAPYFAKSLMEEMKMNGIWPDHITWSILIKTYGNVGDLQGVLQSLKNMCETGIKPDVITYTTVIKACVKNRNPDMAFFIFDKMKKQQLQPSAVTYNTLLRARHTCSNLLEVQQSLDIYEEMRKAGYAPNDNFLKGLLQEWSEGVIQHHTCRNQDDRSNEKLIWKEEENTGSLLEKIAAHVRPDNTKSLTVDLRGLSKTEARIAVLAVLRILRERHGLKNPIKDELVIITGTAKDIDKQSGLSDAIVEVLQNELGLPVIYGNQNDLVPRRHVIFKDGLPNHTYDHQTASDRISTHEEDRKIGSRFEISGIALQKPPTIERLRISRKSLNQWLRKRIDLGGQGNVEVHD